MFIYFLVFWCGPLFGNGHKFGIPHFLLCLNHDHNISFMCSESMKTWALIEPSHTVGRALVTERILSVHYTVPESLLCSLARHQEVISSLPHSQAGSHLIESTRRNVSRSVISHLRCSHKDMAHLFSTPFFSCWGNLGGRLGQNGTGLLSPLDCEVREINFVLTH